MDNLLETVRLVAQRTADIEKALRFDAEKRREPKPNWDSMTSNLAIIWSEIDDDEIIPTEEQIDEFKTLCSNAIKEVFPLLPNKSNQELFEALDKSVEELVTAIENARNNLSGAGIKC